MDEKSFEWVHVHSIEEMHDFYVSRLNAIREAARECGYAIGVHGSLRRDMDLIAVPWVDEHTDADTLARAIHRAACGLEQTSYPWGKKPCGRIAVSFPVCWTADSMGYDTPNLGHIDLSVAPSAKNVSLCKA